MYAQVGQQGQGRDQMLDKAQQMAGQLEQSARKFGGVFKMLFFTCACCVLAAGILSIITCIFSLTAPFDFINYVYLTIFGLLMFFIDFPVDNLTVRNVKMAIFTYALFMTRFVGRGVWYLFLAAMVVGALWDNEVCPFLGLILGGYISAVAIYSLIYGYQLSRKLEGVRLKVVEQGPDQWGAYIPMQGMTKVQFRELAVSLKGTVFSEEELNYIVAAFSAEIRADDLISREEFEEWCRGPGMTIL